MEDRDPILTPDAQPEDNDRALRPQGLDEFIGQAEARSNLKVFIQSARQRGEAMDHTLFYGPPGLGKTTLAQIMSRELGVNFRMTSGPVLAKPGDLAAILTNLEARDVLFIDEIHRLNPVVEEVLYPALEDFQIDIMIGEGPAARPQPTRDHRLNAARGVARRDRHGCGGGPPGRGLHGWRAAPRQRARPSRSRMAVLVHRSALACRSAARGTGSHGPRAPAKCSGQTIWTACGRKRETPRQP